MKTTPGGTTPSAQTLSSIAQRRVADRMGPPTAMPSLRDRRAKGSRWPRALGYREDTQWRCRHKMKRIEILLECFVRRAPHCLGGHDLKTPIMRVLSIRYRELLERSHAVGDVLARYLRRAGGRGTFRPICAGSIVLSCCGMPRPVTTFGRWSIRRRPTKHVFRRVSGSRCSFPNRICSCTHASTRNMSHGMRTRFCTKSTGHSSSAGQRRRSVWTDSSCRGQMIEAGLVLGVIPRLHGQPDGHILDVELLSLRGMGTFRRKILYLRYENNHSWDALFGSGWRVDLKYVCATREGLGMGGCGKSVLQHIYKEGRIETARRIGVEPQYVITWCDYTDEMFRRAASRYYPQLRRIAPYMPEDERGTDHWIYRLWE